jgi:hypothetical protein
LVAQKPQQGEFDMSDDAQRPKISPAIRAAIAKPLRFYFALQSIDGTTWLVVEAGNPEQPLGQLFSSEAEARNVADALNDREVKQRSSDVRQVQQASENGESRE